MKEYNWAVLGCGVIANELAQALQKSGRTIYAVGNRTHDKAVYFAKKYNIKKVYDNYDEMFLDKSVDIVYITTPHNTHIKFLEKALSSGKHVLCEKSITLNSYELDKANKLAKDNNVILAEAMTLYHMPLYKELKKIVKTLGKVNFIQLNFGSYKEYDMTNRFFSRSLAGGSVLDIGVYALSFARWFMSKKPNDILSQVKIIETGVDEQAGILLKNDEDEMCTISLSLHSKQPKRGMISCDKGYIEVYEYPRGERATITFTDTGETEEIKVGDTKNALYYEVMDMEQAITNKNADEMYNEYTKDVMDIMTEIRKSWNMKYPEEE